MHGDRVNWHLVSLPPGVPYEEQQTDLFDIDRGWLDLAPDARSDLCRSLAAALERDDR